MRTSIRIIILFTLLCVGCATTGTKVRDVTELAPPTEVQLIEEGENYKIEWQASYHNDRSDFTGYNVYISSKSLIMAPLADLPEPILLGRDDFSYRLEAERSDGKLFIHVRSRNSKGHVSLPSLPELILP